MSIIGFSDLKTTERINENLAAFSASVNISETQSASQGGINFELDLQYEGTNDVIVHNPIYFVQCILKGRDGAQLLNGGKAPIPLINRKGPIDETTDFNFEIREIRKNGERVNIREHVNMPTIHFQKGDKLSYHLQISKYVNQQTRQDVPDGPGLYHIELLVSIIEADTTGSSLQSRTLRVPDIPISLVK